MKATPACIPCYLKQALAAAREVVSDSETQRMVLNEVAKLLPDLPLDSTPARNSTYVLWRAQELVGCSDPFASKKEHYTQRALKMYPELKAIVQASAQRLSAAVRVAAAGNIIDLGVLDRDDVDLMGVLNEILIQGFTVDECGRFEAQLARVDRVLYLLDNAGETVFDRVLIEELVASGVQITVAAKGEAILNDATMQDAIAAGLDEVASLISNGSPTLGTELESCSAEFLRHFDAADLVVSKGQANFETLDGTARHTFFILKTKCSEVGRELGVAMGDAVATFDRSADGKAP
jgi:uncharacterized protein with ATP-grasp and redox domains